MTAAAAARASDRRMIVVLGGTGQIGRELAVAVPRFADVATPTRGEIDLTRADTVRGYLRRVRPWAIINAAAYTAVDRAEAEPELCFQVNAQAVRTVAEEARAFGAIMVQYSTDYVFNGESSIPYLETEPTSPLSVYGESKLAGERAVQEIGGSYLILRTSWIYGPHGSNFLRTVLRLARERPELRIVNDQRGAPTSSRAVATATAQILSGLSGARIASADATWSGVYHLTAAGETTWYEFARAILAGDPRPDEQCCKRVVPISTSEYPTAARRPLFSVLDGSKVRARFDVKMADWKAELAGVLASQGTSRPVDADPNAA